MNLFERIIKYAAITFAMLLSFGIIAGILTGVLAAAGMFSEGGTVFEMEQVDMTKEFSNVKNLKVDISFGKVEIIEGDGFRVTATAIPSDCIIAVQNETLIVEREKDDLFEVPFFNWKQYKKAHIVIEVPVGFVMHTAELEAGAGSFFVEKLSAENLILDTGSGSFVGKQLSARKTDMDTGSGNITIEDTVFGELTLESGSGLVRMCEVTAHDVKFDSGSGSISIEGTLTGDCSFQTGSGRVDLLLYGDRKEYRILTDIGSGSFWLDGNRIKEDTIDISAKHTLEFDMGSGSVSVEFKEHHKEYH